jgi:hypothetical protein
LKKQCKASGDHGVSLLPGFYAASNGLVQRFYGFDSMGDGDGHEISIFIGVASQVRGGQCQHGMEKKVVLSLLVSAS